MHPREELILFVAVACVVFGIWAARTFLLYWRTRNDKPPE